MKVYFVRHGATEDLDGRIHQHRHSHLSAKGKKQAEQVAGRVSSLPIDLILASPYDRTKETAEIIAERLKKEVSFNDLLREIKRPTVAEQKPYEDPETVVIMDEIKKNFFDSTWHHSDEENFNEVVQRAIDFVRILGEFPSEHILVVSHGMFIKIIMMVMMAGKGLSADLYMMVNDFFHATNTGLTICEKTDDKWTLLTWNDYAHLPE